MRWVTLTNLAFVDLASRFCCEILIHVRVFDLDSELAIIDCVLWLGVRFDVQLAHLRTQILEHAFSLKLSTRWKFGGGVQHDADGLSLFLLLDEMNLLVNATGSFVLCICHA